MKLHFEGWIINDDGVCLSENRNLGYGNLLANEIGCSVPYELCKKDSVLSKDADYSDDNCMQTLNVENACVSMHISDDRISENKAIENQILSSIGELDIHTSWYGYSEYTILGYDVDNFKIGNHNLEDILLNYIGKYLHIYIEFVENV